MVVEDDYVWFVGDPSQGYHVFYRDVKSKRLKSQEVKKREVMELINKEEKTGLIWDWTFSPKIKTYIKSIGGDPDWRQIQQIMTFFCNQYPVITSTKKWPTQLIHTTSNTYRLFTEKIKTDGFDQVLAEAEKEVRSIMGSVTRL